jgi:CIC family chloride channel protein
MVGGGIGALASQSWPFATSPAGAYVLVGMGTFFAAFFRTPMTSFFMIFELSATYAVILPAMVANTIAYLVSRSLQPTGVFEAVASLEGTVMPAIHEQRERAERHVEDSMIPVDRMLVIQSSASVASVMARLAERAGEPVMVALDRERWAALPPEDQIREAVERDADRPLDLACPLTPARVLYRDEQIDEALSALATAPIIPVVTRTSPRVLLGCVTLDGVLGIFGHPGADMP